MRVKEPNVCKHTRDDGCHLMLDAIIERNNQDPADKSASVTAPHIPRNIASTPQPDKAEVIARHTSRFSAS